MIDMYEITNKMSDAEISSWLNCAHSSVNIFEKAEREIIHQECQIRNFINEHKGLPLIKISTHNRFYLTECPELLEDDHQYKGIDRDFPKYPDMPD
jgi:hypothetical protein